MALALRTVASALTLALSSCFNPAGNESDTAPATDTGTAATSATETADTGGPTSAGPTSAGPTSEPTTAVNTDSGPPTSGTSDPSSGTTAVPESCSDKQQNGDETDLDCGGSCGPCEADLGCLENSDCVSMACLGEKCLGDPACLDDAGCDAAVCFLASCVDFACGDQDPQTGPDCDDGLVCTADDSCDDGVCKGSSPKPIALAELPGDPSLGLFYDGIGDGQNTGIKVGDAGDFNGDGTPDLYVSTNYNLLSGPPRVYVLFGGPTLASATLTGVAAGDGGLMIEVDVDSPNVHVAAARDVNKDGKDDLVLGTSAPLKTATKGGAYVIPGRASTTVIKLSAPPQDVALIIGPNNTPSSNFGDAVAGLGDTNGDGFADFAVGAPNAKVNNTTPGAVFVVLGQALMPNATIEQYMTGNQAYRIGGPATGVNLGGSVAGIGDFNKDGFADLAIGQPSWMTKGRVYVLYLKKLPDDIQLGDTMASGEGLVVTGKNFFASSLLGLTVGGAGDFNMDGYSDLLVGGATLLKQAMVVFGGTLATEVDASTLVAMKRGQVITTLQVDGLGASLGGGHDVNGDMIDDVVLGAPFSGQSGQSYVVFGSMAEPATRTVAQLAAGKGGYAIAGAGTTSESGKSVALVPSVNGDDFADVLVGAPQFDVMGGDNKGRAYVVYGGKCGG